VTVENIRNAISADAEREADRIRQAGRNRADEKFRQGRQSLQREFERRIADAEQLEQDKKNRSVIALRSARGMEVLSAKNAVIDEVFDKAVEKLVGLPSGGYKELLLKWLGDAATGDPAELVLNARDKQAIGPELLDRTNKGRNEGSAVTLAEESAEISGGFVLRTERYEIDRTLDSIIADLKEDMAPEIAAELFAGRVERL